MPTKLDSFFEEILETEIDLNEVWGKYGIGFQAMKEFCLPTDSKIENPEEIISQREQMMLVHMLKLQSDARKNVRHEQDFTKIKLRDLQLAKFLQESKADEEQLLIEGTDMTRRELEAVNESVADTLGTKPSTSEELDELAVEAEKVFRWTFEEAETWVDHIVLVAAEKIYKLARTSRSDLLAALDAAFGPEKEEGFNEVELSLYIQEKIGGTNQNDHL